MDSVDKAYILGYCEATHVSPMDCIVTFQQEKIKQKFIMKLKNCIDDVKYIDNGDSITCVGLKLLLNDDYSTSLIPQWIYEADVYTRFYCFGILDMKYPDDDCVYKGDKQRTSYTFLVNLAKMLSSILECYVDRTHLTIRV